MEEITCGVVGPGAARIRTRYDSERTQKRSRRMATDSEKVRGEDLPLISVVNDARVMARLKEYLTTIHEYHASAKEIEAVLDEARDAVKKMYVDCNLDTVLPNGFRFGQMGIMRSVVTKRTLSSKALLAAGVKSSLIEQGYEESTYVMLKVWP